MVKKILLVLVVIIILLIGGLTLLSSVSMCPIGLSQASWELEAWVYEETALQDGGVELEIEVVSSGHSVATFHNVVIEYEDINGTVFRRTHLGTFSGNWNETRTIQLNNIPERIRLEIGTLEEENPDAEYWIKGLQRANGSYEPFVQIHKEC
ncbi:hypothetical protein [Halorhabdus tiamatea]|uniref:hypothetical protein n=1 Tax=Halorhabdus tiamatea TaxID=430914 RepID=UPI0011D2589E|nr:hypothetical protein [Halorhabdus tiamatea]